MPGRCVRIRPFCRRGATAILRWSGGGSPRRAWMACSATFRRMACGPFSGELYSHLLYLRGPGDARLILSKLVDDPVEAHARLRLRSAFRVGGVQNAARNLSISNARLVPGTRTQRDFRRYPRGLLERTQWAVVAGHRRTGDRTADAL